jgi:hypothetical protein
MLPQWRRKGFKMYHTINEEEDKEANLLRYSREMSRINI